MGISEESKVTFATAARHEPRMRAGKPTHPATLGRWSKAGVWINGQNIKLETTQHGGKSCTTLEAVARFHARCAAARAGEPVPEAVQPAGRGHEAACRALDLAGI